MNRVFDKKSIKPQDREREMERVVGEILGRYCNDTAAPMMDPNDSSTVCKV
jgi:hypothetical protein